MLCCLVLHLQIEESSHVYGVRKAILDETPDSIDAAPILHIPPGKMQKRLQVGRGTLGHRMPVARRPKGAMMKDQDRDCAKCKAALLCIARSKGLMRCHQCGFLFVVGNQRNGRGTMGLVYPLGNRCPKEKLKLHPNYPPDFITSCFGHGDLA